MRIIRMESGGVMLTCDNEEFHAIHVSVCAHTEALERIQLEESGMQPVLLTALLDVQRAIHTTLHEFSDAQRANEQAEKEATNG